MTAAGGALGEALAQPVFLFDREQLCRFHNPAAAQVAQLEEGAIDGRPLREIIGDAAYVDVKAQVDASLAASTADGLWLVLNPCIPGPHVTAPGGFLPEAERYGMMEQLDRWVVRRLITHCMERRAREPGWPLPLYCVNLSSAALKAPNFTRFVQQQIQTRKFDGRVLCFELAEADVVSLPAQVQRFVAMLKPFGCRFTIDAFGSMKGSFAPLRDLAVDFIKIDGVVIQNILRDPEQLARTRAIATVCRKVGARSIAEFVESRETLGALRRVGVDYAQGFGIDLPHRLGAGETVGTRQS